MIDSTERFAKGRRRDAAGETRQWPLGGALLVARQRVRRTLRRDLLWMALLLAALLGVSGLLETEPPTPSGGMVSSPLFWQGTAIYLFSVHAFCLRWLLTFVFGAALVLMPLAGVMGAQAVPRAPEKEAVQAALLTRLRAGDVCLGRLLAALWPLAVLLGVSCAGWTCLQLGTRFVPEMGTGIKQIWSVHLVLLGSAWLAGSVGFVFATRLRPGAVWGRGAVMGLGTAVLCLGGIVLVNPLVQSLHDPVPLINGTLLLNPLAGAASALKVDVLRTRWLYAHTDAHDYPFAYPAAWVTAGVFLVIGAICIGAAAWGMRRAYHNYAE